ncbi:MAG TPA: AraC family transcriptional regulator, partial [Ramlibacter sp.]|nr:AraC family transcriptional regulator [Ramlibacter sp.]
MDVLSDILAVCRSEHAAPARIALTAPWGLASTGVPGALVRFARGAPYWMEVQGEAPIQVAPGDLVLLPPMLPHRIVSQPGVPVATFDELIARHSDGPRDENPLVFALGGGGPGTELFSTQVWLSAYCRHTVLPLMQPFIHARAQDMVLAASLGALMESVTQECLARRPGWRLSAARMGELLLVNLLRAHLARHPAPGSGWLRGLADPGTARALQRMHRAPEQGWTLASLAREAGMSRTRFSERFRELVGTTPIGYLTAHRMALAAQALEEAAMPLARIAERAGYDSAKVFARAFRRWSGSPPSVWARREAQR